MDLRLVAVNDVIFDVEVQSNDQLAVMEEIRRRTGPFDLGWVLGREPAETGTSPGRQCVVNLDQVIEISFEG